MTTYKDAGVDREAGNSASKVAYKHASSTFASRKGAIGSAVEEEGGFAGMLDMGDFFLIQNDDGTGSKMELACAMQTYDTLGYDLLAMVVDDAICTGAEVISVSNTLDVGSVDADIVDGLLAGLSAACSQQRIVIPGGEIAEVPDAVNSPVWNATSVGIVRKDRVIDTSTIAEGDSVIALRSGVLRSNGFSLARTILADTFGQEWCTQEWKDGMTWGGVLLTPSVIYHDALLSVLGRYDEDRSLDVKGITHVTGGGIPENMARTLKKSGLGANLKTLWEPHDAIKDLIDLGSVHIEEAYKTWNMGNSMLVIVAPEESDALIEAMTQKHVEAKVAGEITNTGNVHLTAYTGEEIVC